MQTKINTLKSLLPSSPFVAEQVSMALKIAQDNATEEDVMKALDQAIYLTELSNKFSNPNFYAYRPIVCALLSVVGEDVDLSMFATETNSVLVTLAQLREFIAKFDSNTKEACTFFCKSIIDKTDLPMVGFSWMTETVKANKNLVDLLRVAYISTNVLMSKFDLTEATYEAFNDMLKAVDKAEF